MHNEPNTIDLTGEYEDRNFVVTRGDSRIAMTLARNEKTTKLSRHNRFIIDDPDSSVKLAYLLTKPLKLGWAFNNKGAYKFVLQEVVTTDDDNLELGIADYYKFFPKPDARIKEEEIIINDDTTPRKKVWL